MSIESLVREAAEERLGKTVEFELDWPSRVYLAWRTFLHVFGIHHEIRTYRWDERLQYLVDEGVACRVCNRRD